MTTTAAKTNEQTANPIYDDKANAYLRALAEGKTREEIAAAEGNKSWKSVDMHMRRRNFQWDSHRQTYVPKATEVTEWQVVDSSKAGTIIALLKKNTGHQNKLPTVLASKTIKKWRSICSLEVMNGALKQTTMSSRLEL